MTRSLGVACAVLAILLGSAVESRACGLGWFSNYCSPCGTTTYRPLFPFLTGYRGACGCGSTCGCNTCNTCAPQVSSCQSCYRPVCSPVVTYRPVMSCGSCCPTTVLRPTCNTGCGVPVTSYSVAPAAGYSVAPQMVAPAAVVPTYGAPAYSAPAHGAPGCSSCGASISNPSAPVVSRIVTQQSPALTYSSPAAVSAPAAAYAPANGSFSPPGGSYTTASPVITSPIAPRSNAVSGQPALLAPQATSGARTLQQRPLPEDRAVSPATQIEESNDPSIDRTTRLPSHRTWSDQPIESGKSAVIQTQHTRPAKKKIDDSGWRPLR